MIAGHGWSDGSGQGRLPDPDDNIGPIQELRFTQSELDDASINFATSRRA